MWLFRKRVDVLKSSTDDLEQYDQRNNLILSSTTDWVSDDDLEETKNAILSDIDVQVTANDAQSCHRIGQSSSAFWTETKSTVEKYLKKNIGFQLLLQIYICKGTLKSLPMKI